MNEIHELNEQLFSTIFTIINDSDVYDDDIHRFHNVFTFETKDILKDLHAIIDKLNKTLEIFNGISHKTVKSLRKQLLYLKDKFKNIEQSLKAGHTSFISIKIYLKINNTFICERLRCKRCINETSIGKI